MEQGPGSRDFGSTGTSKVQGTRCTSQGLIVHLEGEVEPSPGQANVSDSTAVGMLRVPAWTCPSIENATPDSALHPSSSSLSSLFSGGDTRQLNRKPSAESGPAVAVLVVRRSSPAPESRYSHYLTVPRGRAAARTGQGGACHGCSLD